MAQDKVALKTGATLRTFLNGVIDESVKAGLHQRALREKEKQVAAGSQGGTNNSGSGDGEDTDLFGGSDSGGDGEATAPAAPSKTMDDESNKMKSGDVKAKDVVERLNSIRSGKSFKDDKVKAAMEEYVESLSKAERVALFAFLKGIAQIVTGEVQGQQATEPDSHPADVTMQKGDQHQTKHVDPNVIKGAAPKPKKQGGENTSAPVPITPKRK